MDRLKVLRLYLATRLHFTNDKYDIFQYKAAVKNCNDLTLNKSKQRRSLVERLAKRFNTPGQVMGYLFPQWLYSDGASLYDQIDSEDNYNRWQKFRSAPEYHVMNDLADYDINWIMSGDLPEIITLILAGKIQLETGVVLQKLYGFLSKDKDYFVYNRLCGKIIKSVGYITIDENLLRKELILSH
jgi:hypothetical protein